MAKIKENVINLSFMLSIPLMGWGYGILNRAPRGAQSLVTDLDRHIPFIKEFIVPYILWYPFIIVCMVYFCLKDRKVYFRTLAGIILGMATSFVIFYIFQTYVPRPIIEGNDIFSRLTAKIYMSDRPYNCFPSLHVLESYLMIKGIDSCSNKRKFTRFSIYFMSILIIVSTQFVKQHVLMDVVGGIYVGEIIYNAIPNMARTLKLMTKRSLGYTINQ